MYQFYLAVEYHTCLELSNRRFHSRGPAAEEAGIAFMCSRLDVPATPTARSLGDAMRQEVGRVAGDSPWQARMWLFAPRNLAEKLAIWICLWYTPVDRTLGVTDA